MRKYRIQKVEAVVDLEVFGTINYREQAALILDVITIFIRLKGKSCFYYTSTTMCQDKDVLKKVLAFVKLYNDNFDNRKKNKGKVKFDKRNDAEPAKKPKGKPRKQLIITKRKKYLSYDKFSKVSSYADYTVIYDQHNKVLAFARISGRTCHYYIMRNENGLTALSAVCEYFRRWNYRILTARHKRHSVTAKAA